MSYHHAVFPVPPLPAILTPPLLRRPSIAQSQAKRSKPRHTLNPLIDPVGGGVGGSTANSGRSTPAVRLGPGGEEMVVMEEDHSLLLHSSQQPSRGGGGSPTPEGSTSSSQRGTKRPHSRMTPTTTWHEPKTVEFSHLTAYDSPLAVTNRLASKAKLHWDMRESVKEGETLTNFIFALRMRGVSTSCLRLTESASAADDDNDHIRQNAAGYSSRLILDGS